MDIDGGRRVEVAGDPDHLYFGPVWSPDGAWLAYLDCEPADDPGHDWANLSVGRPYGSEHRVLTLGMSQWFGTSFGGPETRGSGSNMISWSPDGKTLTFTLAQPGSRTAWVFRPDRPDIDHFNRDYDPDAASGGTALCLLNPFTGDVAEIVPYVSDIWNFRAVWSPDGTRLAFCRSTVGEPSGLWMVNADGTDLRLLTYGFDGRGADHPVWL
ncbi:MAG: PD40 domain-containing protein [candidate division Zixibacteria bacterium]|nr:PD40 domain-containing protein [candidate division Zixibacteria bacterium]